MERIFGSRCPITLEKDIRTAGSSLLVRVGGLLERIRKGIAGASASEDIRTLKSCFSREGSQDIEVRFDFDKRYQDLDVP